MCIRDRHKPDKAPRRSRRSGREDFPAEFDEVRSYEIRQKLRPMKKQKPAKEKKAAKQKKKVSKAVSYTHLDVYKRQVWYLH